MRRVPFRVRHVLAALALVSGVPGPASAGDSIGSGVEVPFAYADLATGCVATGAVTMYPAVDYGPLGTDLYVAQESFRATVKSPSCPTTWTVKVTIADVSPGFLPYVTSAAGTGGAAAAQGVHYAMIGRAGPTPVRGAASVEMRVEYHDPAGFTGCRSSRWALAPFAAPVETGPVVPCLYAVAA